MPFFQRLRGANSPRVNNARCLNWGNNVLQISPAIRKRTITQCVFSSQSGDQGDLLPRRFASFLLIPQSRSFSTKARQVPTYPHAQTQLSVREAQKRHGKEGQKGRKAVA